MAPVGLMASAVRPCAPLSDVGRTTWSVPSAVRTNPNTSPPVPGMLPIRVNLTAACPAAGAVGTQP